MSLLRSWLLVAVAGQACLARDAELPPAKPGDQAVGAAAGLTLRIDQCVDARLDSAGIPTSPRSTDQEFVRRIYLDLHGVIPTAEQTTAFLRDSSTDKRSTLIDALLADRRFAAHLADLWDDYLMPTADDVRMQKQHLKSWLETAFQASRWNQLATELLTATGRRDDTPAVAYLLKGRETLTPAETTDLVSQYFLGVRLNCAQCHDHPFADWKQSDYWGMAAFFTQFQYTDRRLLKSGLIRDDPSVDLDVLEDAARLRTLRFPKGDEWPVDDTPHRQAFARWLTADDNPYFARAATNRVWAQLFGRGLVEPVDDIHEGNAASHPELLDELSAGFAASGFELRTLYRAVCNSSAYQRTSLPTPRNAEDAILLSHMRIKVLSPEQLYDSLAIVLPPARSAKGAARNLDPREEFVAFFGSEGDSDPTAYGRGIPQTLRLMNSEQWWSPRRDAANVRQLVEDEATDAQALERLYLGTLSRSPTDDERRVLVEFLAAHSLEREQALAEILWSLVNSGEFSFNH